MNVTYSKSPIKYHIQNNGTLLILRLGKPSITMQVCNFNHY